MSNKLCRFLSNGYKINVDHQGLQWSPCCFYSKKVPLLDKTAFDKELARTSAARYWLPECWTCTQMETSGAVGLSPRLTSFNKIPNDMPDGVCGALEINLDLACNAACLSCGGYASSTWQKYDIKHNIRNSYPPSQAESYLDQLIATVPMDQLQSLCILGGEPFYSSTNLKLLQHLQKVHPALHTVTLQYQTNGSIIPDPEVISLWKNFKTVTVSLSLDGVGQRFEYLRWPLKWHRVESTVDFLLHNTSVLFNVNATVNPLSVLYFDEIESWTLQTIPGDRMMKRLHNPVRVNRCTGTMDLNLTPRVLRDAANLKYGDEHKLSKIFSNLEYSRGLDKMFEYVNQHDQLRRLSWQDTFPNVVEYYRDFASEALDASTSLN